MSIESAVQELQSIYRQPYDETGAPDRRLGASDIDRWSTTCGLSRSRFCDELALSLATGFHRGELPYSFCDWIMTDVYGAMITLDEPMSALAWRVFIAFDEGEYRHGRNPNEDPVAIYTRPMIAEILNTAGLI